MENILVTGGAGYIGSVLVRLLLKNGFNVRVMDKLLFGGESIIELLNEDNFEFFYGDIRDKDTADKAINGMDAVVHLAAIVGDPACSKQQDLARSTNLESTKQLYKLSEKKGLNRFIFASTCSNYGKMEDPKGYVTEKTELRPISLYAETKVESENFLLNQDKSNSCKPTCLRFSTVYGLSPRIRFDLTVNEFVKEFGLGREFFIYGEQFWRPYAHVVDLARSVELVLNSEENKVAFNVFNVGDTSENYQKGMIVDEIKKFIPDMKVKYVDKDEDPRDYRVSFEKIKNKLGYKISKRLPDGISQVLQAVRDGLIQNPDDTKYRNI
jgi:nucleoside-diphosphate-sugar epimerase